MKTPRDWSIGSYSVTLLYQLWWRRLHRQRQMFCHVL